MPRKNNVGKPGFGPNARIGKTRSMSQLLANEIRSIAEAKGITETRLLTEWREIAGPELARISRPVEVRHPWKSMRGAVLVLEVPGSRVQEVRMSKEALLERVNAAYGYAAIRDIRTKQTSLARFSRLNSGRKRIGKASPETRQKVWNLVSNVSDEQLRKELFELGCRAL